VLELGKEVERVATKKILVGAYDINGDGYHVEWDPLDTLVDPNGVPIAGVTNFLGLSDTPGTYTGHDGEYVTVSGAGLVFTPLSVSPTALEFYNATGDIVPANNTYVLPGPKPDYVTGSIHAFVNGRKLLKLQVIELGDNRTVNIFEIDGITPLYLDGDPVLGETLEFLYAAN